MKFILDLDLKANYKLFESLVNSIMAIALRKLISQRKRTGTCFIARLKLAKRSKSMRFGFYDVTRESSSASLTRALLA